MRGEPRLTDPTNPGALPIEPPMMVEWVITLKTAQALGVEIRLPGDALMWSVCASSPRI